MNYPGDKDIICGNLKLFTDHLGNRRFQMLVHLYQTHSLISKEHSPRRTEALVKEIMRVLQQSGYRFLKFHKNGELASVKPLGVMKVVHDAVVSQFKSATEQVNFPFMSFDDLKKRCIDVMTYIESVTPLHPQDAWTHEWRLARFKHGVRAALTQTPESMRKSDHENRLLLFDPTSEHTQNGTIITSPSRRMHGNLGDKDVLIGYDGTFSSNLVANARFQKILEANARAFSDASSRELKMEVVHKIMTVLQVDGFRFSSIDQDGHLMALSNASVKKMIVMSFQQTREQHYHLDDGTGEQKTESPLDRSSCGSTQFHGEPPLKKKRYIAAIDDIIVPAMKNGNLPLKGYWKFFPLPHLGHTIDLGERPSGWNLILEPIAFEADSIKLAVPSLEREP